MYTGRVSVGVAITGMEEDTHNALIGHIRISFQMEKHRHIVLVVRSIEARDVDQGAA